MSSDGSPLEYVSGLEVLDLSQNMGLTQDELEILFQPLKTGGRLRELYLSRNNYGNVPTAALAQVRTGRYSYCILFFAENNVEFKYIDKLLLLMPIRNLIL